MWANAAGSAAIALLWGIALANLIHGVPLDGNSDYAGNLADLFGGYTVLSGIAFVLVFAFHGASFLTLRTTDDLCERARRAARRLAVPAVVVGAAFVIWTVAVAVDRNDKDVFPAIVPAVIAIAALAVAALLVYAGRSGLAFGLTVLAIAAAVATLFTGLYPRVIVSSPNFGNSLEVADAASAHYTLAVMTVVAAIVTPVVLLYQSWTYYVFRARVTGEGVHAPTEALARPTGDSPAG
jgi:cytochrome d ubiquinol oxidase subunit II